MKAELVPDDGGAPIRITRDVTVIGRREYCDIQLDHPSLSKRHAVLVRTDGLLILRDLVSTNGTKVKGQRIRWAALLPDDRISIGSLKFSVYLGPDHLPAPSERPRPKTKAAPGRPAPVVATTKPSDGFASPSPMGIPVVKSNSSKKQAAPVGGDTSEDWRHAMKPAPQVNLAGFSQTNEHELELIEDDDDIIELS